jgi:hypothetical protein
LAHFQIRGRIETLGPKHFLAVARATSSAIDEPATYELTDTANSLEDARSVLDHMVIALGAKIRHWENSVAGSELP